MAIRQRTPDLAQSEGLRTVKTHTRARPPFRYVTMKPAPLSSAVQGCCTIRHRLSGR